MALTIALACADAAAAYAQTATAPPATTPDPAKPDPTQPDTAKPDPAKPATAQDEAQTPATTPTLAPDTPAKPATKRAGKPGTTQRDASDDGTIEVTGSRIKGGDPTAQVLVLTAADIKARGVTSAEELLRTLPQNLATIGAITNERTKGPLSAAARGKAAVSELGSLGVSAANLGGSGAGNTLVLINGRRVAGAAGIEDGFVNLNSIPLSAVERVEIDTSGSAAIYGADAIGGVINFILRKNYTGTTLSAQHEFSANSARVTRFNAASGYGWGSGGVSGTLSYDRRDPINNFKSGYRTQNYSSYYGGDPQYDLRDWSRGLQPGVIVINDTVYDPATDDFIVTQRGISVRPGLTGAPTLDDFVTLDPNTKRDYIPKFAGPKLETLGGSLNFDQKITRTLSLFVNGLYTHTRATQDQDYSTGLQVQLAPGQAYNPFPAFAIDPAVASTTVNYFPQAELANRTIVPTQAISTNDSWSINSGLTWNVGKHTKIEFVFSTSSSKSAARSTQLASLVDFVPDPTQPSGYACFNFQLANGLYTGRARDAVQAAFDKQCRALTSADPAVAFNPWRSGAGGPGGAVTDFIYEDAREQRESQNKNYELRINGNLLKLPAGPLVYAIGGEYNDDGVNSREVNAFTGTAASIRRYAFFGEAIIPVLDGRIGVPFARELTLNAAVRNDTSLIDGAVGTVDDVPFDQGGKLIFAKNRFSRFTPSLGVRWVPVRDLAFRAKWSSGFRAPPFSQLFDVAGSRVNLVQISDDPIYTCTTDCAFSPNSGIYTVPRKTAPNPNLKPQTSKQQSFSATWTPSGALSGLTAVVTYNHTRIRNEYANLARLLSVISTRESLRLATFYPRDQNGKITQLNNFTFNIAGSEYSSVNVEAHWALSTRIGTFTPGVNYLRNLTSERQILDSTAPISTLGKVSGVDRYKVVGQLAWSHKDVDLTLWGYYTPPYDNDYVTALFGGVLADVDKIRRVHSLTTFDLTGSWNIAPKLRLNFAARNMFAAKPPLVVIDARPYDTARYNAAGRTVSFELQKSF